MAPIELKQRLQKLVDKGFIQLKKKNDGLMKLYIDYQQLNNVTIHNEYPLVWIDAMFNQLHEFLKIDMRLCNYQLKIQESDIPKVASTSCYGQ